MQGHGETPAPSNRPADDARYAIIVPQPTLARAQDCLAQMRSGHYEPGRLLADRLATEDLATLDGLDLLGALFDTKRPQIFAEMAVAGDGSDWTRVELGLLGDVSVAVPVTVFDDGNHHAPTAHPQPFEGTLLFTPGALLRNGRGLPPADWQEVTDAGGQLVDDGYYALYRRRLLPVLHYVNAMAGTARSALVTVPGLGCGQFAGPFHGQLGARLQAVLQRLLREHGATLPNLKALYFDPYGECSNAREDIHGIALLVRPLRSAGNQHKSQLCAPRTFAEAGDGFAACRLFSVVAWDHVSWPGNDFFAGSRATDDGVKAAATSSMATLTGVEGRYDAAQGKYLPPAPYSTWGQLVLAAIAEDRLRLWNRHAVWVSP